MFGEIKMQEILPGFSFLSPPTTALVVTIPWTLQTLLGMCAQGRKVVCPAVLSLALCEHWHTYAAPVLIIGNAFPSSKTIPLLSGCST